MTRSVEFHEAAFVELDAAFDWYFARSAPVAAAFPDEFERALDLIAASPATWPSYYQDTRKFILKRFPFLSYIAKKPPSFKLLP